MKESDKKFSFVEKEITMAATLSFGDAMKAIPNFAGGSEGLLTIFINKCEFVLRHTDDSMKPIILDAIKQMKLSDIEKLPLGRN
jgi:hypothetical protein